jgi:hypothetical protein
MISSLRWFAVSMMCLAQIAAAHAQTVPPIVDAEIQKAVAACEPEHAMWDQGFITQKDINADGVSDYVLDYGKFICGDSTTYFCGTAGCLTQVFASLPGGTYVKVLDDNVRQLQFRTLRGRPAMLIDVHGSVCGRTGASACDMTLYWNGSQFSPAN